MAQTTTSSATAAPRTPPSGRLGLFQGRAASLFVLLLGANLAAWVWALLAFRHHPVLLGTALVAYAFGLRHAVDADHIAAIDNVTRKLMQQGKRPVGVGLSFSLGHSTVVFGLSVAIAWTSVAIQGHPAFASVGGVIGTLVSAFFLLAVALANVLVLVSLYRTFQQVRQGGRFTDDSLNLLLAKRGFLGRIFCRLFDFIQHGWQMYFVGFLFGLGFDTATEVGVLGISATEATQGLPVWSILVFPTLFAAGMALVDSAVNGLMLSAYGWAFVKPIRKLYYNLIITFISVVVALLVGGMEVLGLVGDHLKIQGTLWHWISVLNRQFTVVGFGIIGIMLASWCLSVLFYRLNRYDEIEVPTDPVS